jgi:hypothetical protein
MEFKHAVHVRRAVVALAATVALSAVASPALAQARTAVGPTIDDPKQYGDWIADVERPAEQVRGRYQLRLGEAHKLLTASARAR